MADAAVSKTVGGQLSCRFDSDLRHQSIISLQQPLSPLLFFTDKDILQLIMDVFFVVLQSVLVLLGIGVIGFWITRRGIIPEQVHGFISRLAIDIALPCMVFSSVLTTFTPEKFPDWWQLPLWWLAYTAIALALSMVSMFLAARETRREFALNLFYQNGLFFPLIIISGVFGTNTVYLPQLYIFIMLHPALFFGTYQLFFKKKFAGESLSWHRIINPVLIATLVAIIVQLFRGGAYLPDFVHTIFKILGDMALPLIMIILGGSLYLDFRQRGKFYLKEIVKFLALKNIVFPLVCLGILLLIKPDYSIALLFILQSAVPPVTSTPILTERSGGNKAISTQFVFSSFVFSIVSIPLIFLLFNRFFPMP
jgi:predicted permease